MLHEQNDPILLNSYRPLMGHIRGYISFCINELWLTPSGCWDAKAAPWSRRRPSNAVDLPRALQDTCKTLSFTRALDSRHKGGCCIYYVYGPP